MKLIKCNEVELAKLFKNLEDPCAEDNEMIRLINKAVAIYKKCRNLRLAWAKAMYNDEREKMEDLEDKITELVGELHELVDEANEINASMSWWGPDFRTRWKIGSVLEQSSDWSSPHFFQRNFRNIAALSIGVAAGHMIGVSIRNFAA